MATGMAVTAADPSGLWGLMKERHGQWVGDGGITSGW